MDFYSRGNPADGDPVVTGTVVEADNYTSLVRLDQTVSANQPTDSWALKTGRFLGKVQVALAQTLRNHPSMKERSVAFGKPEGFTDNNRQRW